MEHLTVFKGTVVHSKSLGTLEVLEQAYVGVQDSQIVFVETDLDAISASLWPLDARGGVVDLGGKFLVPGMVDTHAHAPQYVFMGTGRIPLLQWLEKYTFPTEAKFQDLSFAKNAYEKSVLRHLRYGTTTICYFATIHTEASVLLAKMLDRIGVRAYVGKVSMDRHSPSFYIEGGAAQALKDEEDFVDRVLQLQSKTVTPIVTPRFVPTCTPELLEGLAALARKHHLPVQSHISENHDEIAWVRDLHPECSSYADVYRTYGLLGDAASPFGAQDGGDALQAAESGTGSVGPVIMAHGIHLSPDEVKMLADHDVAVSHCPNSNFSLGSGVCDVKTLLRQGVNIGLGTDVAGGYSASMLDAIRQSLIASTTLSLEIPSTPTSPSASTPADQSTPTAATAAEPAAAESLDFKEAFYLATLGGARVMGLQNQIGTLEPGKQFDALVVNVSAKDSPIDRFDDDSTLDLFQKWVFLGDDRNIERIFIAGREVGTQEGQVDDVQP